MDSFEKWAEEDLSEDSLRMINELGKRRDGSPSHIRIVKKKGASKSAAPPPEEVEEVDEVTLKARELLKKGKETILDTEADGQRVIPGSGKEIKTNTAIIEQGRVLAKAEKNHRRTGLKVKQETELLTKMMLEADIPKQDLSMDDLEAFIDREPKAKVRKKKDPKKTRPSRSEIEAEAEEADNEEED